MAVLCTNNSLTETFYADLTLKVELSFTTLMDALQNVDIPGVDPTTKGLILGIVSPLFKIKGGSSVTFRNALRMCLPASCANADSRRVVVSEMTDEIIQFIAQINLVGDSNSTIGAITGAVPLVVDVTKCTDPHEIFL